MKTKNDPSSKKQPATPPAAVLPDPGFLTMPEAIELLKTTRPTFYRWVRAGQIKARKVGRQWRFQREDLDRFMQGETPRIELPVDISPLIRTLREKIETVGAKAALEDLPKTSSSVEEAVLLMIAVGGVTKASDIHITTHSMEGKNNGVLRYRIDGMLHPVATFDVRLLPAIVQEWKRLASCDIHEKEKPQDGRIEITIGGAKLDLRFHLLPAYLGESIAVRVLDPSAINLDLPLFGYAPQDLEKLQHILKSPWGLVIVTGQVGTGKTTTLYSCLNQLASPERKLVSVEDPVEYLLPWVTQVAVNPQAGVTFATAARAVLRADPDVIFIGEIRDRETLILAQQMALTGHLVLTSLHTDEAASALKRMIDVGSNPLLIGDTTKLIVAQRLIRKLCPHCSADETPAPGTLDRAAALAQEGGLKWHTMARRFRKPVGCDQCNHTGYRRRAVIAEMLEVTPEISKALRDNASVADLRAIAVKQGMTTMAADGIRRAANGETSLAEVLRTFGIR